MHIFFTTLIPDFTFTSKTSYAYNSRSVANVQINGYILEVISTFTKKCNRQLSFKNTGIFGPLDFRQIPKLS